MLNYKFTKTESKPSAALNNVVEGFWLLSCEGDTSIFTDTNRCLPSGMVEFIIHLDDNRSIGFNNEKWITYPKSYCVGIMVKPIIWRMPTQSSMIGIRFKPEAFIQLFNVKVSDIINTHIDGEAIFGSSINNLIERVLNVVDFKEKIKLLEEFLLDRINRQPLLDNYFTSSLKLIRNNETHFSSKSLTNMLSVSERTLQRLYKENIGVSPKLYQRIIRFKKAVELAETKQMNLTGISYELGYTDQAHFIKDFKEFAGTLPKDVIKTFN